MKITQIYLEENEGCDMAFKDESLMMQMGNDTHDMVKNRWIEAEALIALANRRALWDEINNQYVEHEVDVIQAYVNSSLYDLPVLKTLTIPIRAMAIKAFSLYAWYELQGKEDEWLKTMANKTYKRYVDFVKNNKRFSWEQFFAFMGERNPEMSSADEHHLAVLILRLNGTTLFPTLSDAFGKTIVHNLYQNNQVMGGVDVGMENRKKMEKLPALRKLQDTFKFKIPKEQSLDRYFELHESHLVTKVLSPEEKKEIVGKGNYRALYKKGLFRYYKPLTAILRQHNMDDFNYTSLANITQDDVLNIYSVFEASKELERLKDDEWELYLTSALLLTMMIHHYKDLSDFYFDAVKKQEDLVMKEKQISKGQRSVEQQTKEFDVREKNYEQKISEQDAYIQQLEQQLKEARNEQAETVALKKEVASLRSYAYQHRAEIEEVKAETNPVEKVNILLENKNAVVFGGHPTMVNRLKTTLPDLEYRDVDTINRELEFIGNQDIIFLVTSYFNHPFYYKLMNELEKHPQVRLVYLSGYSNLNRTLNEMADLLES